MSDRKIRIVATFNLDEDDSLEHADSLYDAMLTLSEQVENVVVASGALECPAFGDPVLDSVVIEEEMVQRTWTKWDA